MNEIETVGETVSEETKPAAKVEFSLEACYEWFKDPANEDTIRSWAKRADEGLKTVVSSIDKSVTGVGRLWRDVLQKEDVRTALVDSLLESVGFEKED